MIHSGFLGMLIFDGDYPMAYGALDVMYRNWVRFYEQHLPDH